MSDVAASLPDLSRGTFTVKTSVNGVQRIVSSPEYARMIASQKRRWHEMINWVSLSTARTCTLYYSLRPIWHISPLISKEQPVSCLDQVSGLCWFKYRNSGLLGPGAKPTATSIYSCGEVAVIDRPEGRISAIHSDDLASGDASE